MHSRSTLFFGGIVAMGIFVMQGCSSDSDSDGTEVDGGTEASAGTGGSSGSGGDSGSGDTGGAGGSGGVGGSGGTGGSSGAAEAGVEAGPDAAPDSGPDAAPDSGPDAAPDSGPDAAPDSDPIVYGIPGQSCDGMTGTECQGKSCCSTILVPGGTFPMGRSENGTDAYPGLSIYANIELPEHDVTLSDFYLDEYEVTVGRFRKYVEQYNGPPPVGAGAHPLIAGSGWDAAWDSNLASSQTALLNDLKDYKHYETTWQETPNGTETLPINWLNWYQAFAFCAWDGGRLPTEAEWEYAAAGGSENRLYPWGDTPPNCTLAAYGCDGATPGEILEVGSRPAGAGLWGHHDLAGNMSEWVFDYFEGGWYAGGGSTCHDCANTSAASYRVFRGSYFNSANVKTLRAAARNSHEPTYRYSEYGFRCARTPAG